MFKTFDVSRAALLLATCLGFAPAVHALEAPRVDAPAPVQTIEGDWGGALAGSLRLVLHVTKLPDGRYSAMLESVDQNHALVAVDKFDVTAERLAFACATIHASYDGRWDAGAHAWVGKWTQGPVLALTLARFSGEVAKPARPQEKAIEAAPLPYGRQDVSFAGGAAGVTLAGTFSTPPGSGPFPAVILIAGSGPHARDVDIFGHKVNLVLSDYLTRHGIAVLRYDKRGIGRSSGDYKSATTADFAADAGAAVAYLRTRPEVDARHLGLVGHSEGGLIAPAVAVRDAGVRFIVLLAGPAMRGDKLLAEQIYLVARAGGASEEKGMRMRAVNEQLFEAIGSAPDASAAQARGEVILQRALADKQISGDAASITAGLTQFTRPWMRYFLAYDPVPVLRQVKVPVLALTGSLDLQVPPGPDLAAMREALGSNRDVRIMELPKLNHLLQAARTGAPSEYGTIEETINPVALAIISDWVALHAR